MHAIIMIDQGIDKGLVHKFNTSDRNKRGWKNGFFGFRKMFWDYLNKLHVGFSDPCCDTAGTEGYTGTRFNNNTGETEFWDPINLEWTPVADWVAPGTTTTHH